MSDYGFLVPIVFLLSFAGFFSVRLRYRHLDRWPRRRRFAAPSRGANRCVEAAALWVLSMSVEA